MPDMIGDEGSFVFVTRRRRRRKGESRRKGGTLCNTDDSLCLDQDCPDIDCEVLLRKLSELVLELRSSSFAVNLLNILCESLSDLAASGISEIVCYGLGQFSDRRASKYQLALLILLKNQYGCPVHVYDPSFFVKEIEVLRGLGFEIIGENEEGKRIVGDGITLMYMPHCPTQLTNNFLYANWGKRLSNCIVLANSFSLVLESCTYRNSLEYAGYISRIQPYATEINLRNNFRYQEVFNDFNVHFFPLWNLNKVPPRFWKEKADPCYSILDVEFVQCSKRSGNGCNEKLPVCL